MRKKIVIVTVTVTTSRNRIPKIIPTHSLPRMQTAKHNCPHVVMNSATIYVKQSSNPYNAVVFPRMMIALRPAAIAARNVPKTVESTRYPGIYLICAVLFLIKIIMVKIMVNVSLVHLWIMHQNRQRLCPPCAVRLSHRECPAFVVVHNSKKLNIINVPYATVRPWRLVPMFVVPLWQIIMTLNRAKYRIITKWISAKKTNVNLQQSTWASIEINLYIYWFV